MDDVPIAWSPDGSQLAFGRWDFGACSNRSAIYVVNADGTGEHRITPWASATTTETGQTTGIGSFSPSPGRIRSSWSIRMGPVSPRSRSPRRGASSRATFRGRPTARSS
jgi:hypothetical protein